MERQCCFKIKYHKNLKIEKLNVKGDILENENILLFFIGKIFDTKKNILELTNICTLYLKYGKKVVNYLDGTYSLIIIDKRKKRLYVFQDYFGSNQNIYFYDDRTEIIISNELKQIIKNKNIDWQIDLKSVKNFLDKGFITNEDTLVKFIHKVPGKKYLEINLNNAKYKIKRNIFVKNIYNIKKVNSDSYVKTMEEICDSSKCENIGVTISSGYDTNFLVYNLRKNNNKLKAFSIGGTIGRNEVPNSYFISKYYKNIDFHSKLVDDNSLINYPEIIFALEGAIYESGIFLQYELAKLIKDNNIENMILGDCADQVLHYNLYHPISKFIDKTKYYLKNYAQLCKGISIKPYKDIYEMASYKVLKKSGILMSYYGINAQYPYLRREFVETAKRIVIKGDNNKSYHKDIIHKTLPLEIVKILKKIGGATDLKTLFIGKISLNNIREVAQNSKYYKKKKFNDEFYEIDYFMKIIYLEIFERMFIKEKIIDNENKNNLFYYFPELDKENENGESNISSNK